MSAPLTYRPAYLGLFAAQILAIICNAYLDIQYGDFVTEVLIWALVMGFSLRTGWRQQGVSSDDGKKAMRRYLIFGGIISILMFIPMWGFPRAGVYMLAVMQAAYNCVTTTRKHLHLGLLISLVLVLFATSHFRADWTMLFYLVPYVAAVVFTLVAEQINRKADDLKQQSLGNPVARGQMAAIAAATTVILSLGLAFYIVTPQVTWSYLMWKWGNPTDLGAGGNKAPIGKNGNTPAGGGSGNSPSSGNENQGQGMGIESLTPAEMRQAASRKGMPEWQSGAIYKLADATEWTMVTFKPVGQYLRDLWQAFKKWLQENAHKIAAILFALAILALLYALWRLMREARVVTWLKTRVDYLTLVTLGLHSRNPAAAGMYYAAMERLFLLSNIERTPLKNAREYLEEINSFYRDMAKNTEAMTQLFEEARYGAAQLNSGHTGQMRNLYKKIYDDLKKY